MSWGLSYLHPSPTFPHSIAFRPHLSVCFLAAPCGSLTWPLLTLSVGWGSSPREVRDGHSTRLKGCLYIKCLFSTCVACFGCDPILSTAILPHGNEHSNPWDLWIHLKLKGPHEWCSGK